MALCGFGQFSGLVGNGLLAGRDPKIQSYPHSFLHSDNVPLLYGPVAVSPTSISWAFSKGGFRPLFCIALNTLMLGPVRQALNREIFLCCKDFAGGDPKKWRHPLAATGPSQNIYGVQDPYQEIPMTEIPTDLVVNLELLLAYSPTDGRLWSLDRQGRPVRELKLWRWDEASGRCEISSISIGGKSKRATHVIFRIMVGRYPGAGMVIDHRDRDPTNNAWRNLRECTIAQNNLNRDCSGQRLHGASELLEAGVQKRAAGYVVVLQRLYCGIYQSSVEANQVARRVRRELYGEFALAPVTWRRIWRPAPDR
jgi:hypothetical protein